VPSGNANDLVKRKLEKARRKINSYGTWNWWLSIVKATEDWSGMAALCPYEPVFLRNSGSRVSKTLKVWMGGFMKPCKLRKLAMDLQTRTTSNILFNKSVKLWERIANKHETSPWELQADEFCLGKVIKQLGSSGAERVQVSLKCILLLYKICALVKWNNQGRKSEITITFGTKNTTDVRNWEKERK
jgi:hypothetical protein